MNEQKVIKYNENNSTNKNNNNSSDNQYSYQIKYNESDMEELDVNNNSNNLLLDDSGIYDNTSEYQKIALSNLYIFDDMDIPKEWLNSDGTINKDIKVLYKDCMKKYNDEGNKKYKDIADKLKLLIDSEYGEYTLVEIKKETISNDTINLLLDYLNKKYPEYSAKISDAVKTIYSFDSVVLKDKNGNYIVHYLCTNGGELGDILFDAYQILNSSPEDILNSISTIAQTESVNLKYMNEEKVKKVVNGGNILNILDYSINLFGENYLNGLHIVSKDVAKFENYWQSGAKTIVGEDNYDGFISNSIQILQSIGSITLLRDYQQKEAHSLASKYYDKAKKEGKTINLHGYSLGGNLAERTYISLVNEKGKNDKTINSLILFNPLHDSLSKDEVDLLKNDENVSIYCSEGDIVSGINNQKDLDSKTKYIYIDYDNVINKNVEPNKNSIENSYNVGIYSLHGLPEVLSKDKISFNKDGSIKDTVTITKDNNQIQYKPHAIDNKTIYHKIVDATEKKKKEKKNENK